MLTGPRTSDRDENHPADKAEAEVPRKILGRNELRQKRNIIHKRCRCVQDGTKKAAGQV